MTTNTFKFEHTDDFRLGPRLSVDNWSEKFKSEFGSNPNVYKVKIDITEEFVVYHCLLSIGKVELIEIAKFKI